MTSAESNMQALGINVQRRLYISVWDGEGTLVAKPPLDPEYQVNNNFPAPPNGGVKPRFSKDYDNGSQGWRLTDTYIRIGQLGGLVSHCQQVADHLPDYTLDEQIYPLPPDALFDDFGL